VKYLKTISLIFIIVSLISCSYFLPNDDLEDKINSQIIDYSSIDAYPLLPECQELIDKNLQKECFYKNVSNRIQKTLVTNLNFASQNNIKVLVKINVDAKGKVAIKTINYLDENNLPKLDSLLYLSIENLPLLQPAIKSGIPVSSEFSLPILVKMGSKNSFLSKNKDKK
jgi:hypothetical protein